MRIGEDPWQEDFKINAAQASHLGRIARECHARRFHRVKRRSVTLGNRTLKGAHVARHTLLTISPQILDSRILSCRDCESERRQSRFLGKDSLRRPQRPSFLKPAEARF